MIQFYKQYIHPSSPLRAKLAIHLSAQTPAETGATPATDLVLGVVEKGMKVLGLNGTKNEDQADTETAETEENGTIPFVITDVRQFKSMLQVSAGAQPVKHISEFEESDAKL